MAFPLEICRMTDARRWSINVDFLPFLHDKLVLHASHALWTVRTGVLPNSTLYSHPSLFLLKTLFLNNRSLLLFSCTYRTIMVSHFRQAACLATFIALFTFANAQFVTTNGLQFELNGKPYSFAGANSWTSKVFKQWPYGCTDYLQLVLQIKASSLMPSKLPRI